MLYTAVKLSLQWIRFKQTGFTANQLFTVRPWMAKHTLKQWSADISASGYTNKIIFGSTIVIIVHSRTQSRKKRPRLAAKQVKWAHQTLVTAWTWIRQNQTNTFGHKIQLTLPHQPLPDPKIIHDAINLIWEKSSNSPANVTRLRPQDPSRRANCSMLPANRTQTFQPTVM